MATRRKFKRFKMQAAEQTETIDRLIQICAQHGIRADFAWQLPEILEQALQGNGESLQSSRVGGAPTNYRAPQDAMRRLTATGPVPGTATPTGRTTGSTVQQAQGQEDDLDQEVEEELVGDLNDEFGDSEEDGPALNEQEMLEEYNAKQAAMIRRVAEQGVRYKNSPGPAAGQRLGPHRTVDKKILDAKPKLRRDVDLDALMGGAQEVEEEDDGSFPDLPTTFSEADLDSAEADEIPRQGETGRPVRRPTNGANGRAPGPAARPADDGRVNTKTGMSAAKAREVLSRVIGREVRPPEPGRPNTLKG